jgi:hypothetical protein
MIELQRVSNPEFYVTSSARSSLIGSAGDPHYTPEYWLEQHRVVARGKGKPIRVTPYWTKGLLKYWEDNSPLYRTLIQRWAAEQAAQPLHSRTPMHLWRPLSGPDLTPLEVAMLVPLSSEAKSFSRATLDGIQFRVARDSKDFCGTILAVRYKKETADDTKLPIGSTIVSYGSIQEILVHRPWDVAGTEEEVLLCRVKWFVPVVDPATGKLQLNRHLSLITTEAAHDWNLHPFYPLKLAIPAQIMLVPAHDQPAGHFYPLDLSRKCEAPQYPDKRK